MEPRKIWACALTDCYCILSEQRSMIYLARLALQLEIGLEYSLFYCYCVVCRSFWDAFEQLLTPSETVAWSSGAFLSLNDAQHSMFRIVILTGVALMFLPFSTNIFCDFLKSCGLHRRLREGYRILRCSASTNGDTATPESPVSPETTNGSVRSSSRKPQVWVAIGIAIVAVGLVVSGIVRTNNLFGSNQREASQLLTDMSISASSSQSVEQFTVNWFGRKFFLSERSPG